MALPGLTELILFIILKIRLSILANFIWRIKHYQTLPDSIRPDLTLPDLINTCQITL